MSRDWHLSTFFKGILPFLVLAGLILLFFNKMVFSNLILARGDIFLYFYPYWQAAANALHEGRIPFWNPNIFMGAPFLANSQVGYFYPLNWVVWTFLETPYAVKAAIVGHIFIAGSGTYLAGRKVMGLGRSGSSLAAVAFALGGYLTAQVEHINQLQGLSWLPWFLIAIEAAYGRSIRAWIGSICALVVLFSLQLLAGHTQTTFITGLGLLIWIAARMIEQRLVPAGSADSNLGLSDRSWQPLLVLAAGVVLAFLVSAVQLLPTLELTQLSSRQGGLATKEVLSFSLPLLLLSRTLLPAAGQSLFSEYVAFLPLVFLAMAFLAAWQWREHRRVLPALAWVGMGLLLALGVYNPGYWLLARLPGFNLFRAPARWLVLYALGVSLLAGVGWQLLWQQFQAMAGGKLEVEPLGDLRHSTIWPLRIFLMLSVLLFIWGVLAGFLTNWLPTGAEAPFEFPSLLTLLLWTCEWFLLLAVTLTLSGRIPLPGKKWLIGLLAIVGLAILFIASRPMAYNNLTTPEAFFDLRPPVSRLQAENESRPGRFLSLSDIFFDSGDQAEIDSIYKNQLPLSAQYDYTIAIKQKEIIAPNLPMIYGLHSVDGFDGGILPLQSYSQMSELILPDGEATTDGRLREHLSQVPEKKWLDLFNTRYLITDKVGDVWHNGIFFDRQHAVELKAGEVVTVGYLPEYEATGLQIMAAHQPGPVRAQTADGQVWELMPEEISAGLYALSWPTPAPINQLTVGSCGSGTTCLLEALTLVDERDGSFFSIVPGNYRLIYSGDVKIYENLDVMPRAFIVHQWQPALDNQAAFAYMDSSEFDPQRTAVIVETNDIPVSMPDVSDETGYSFVAVEEYDPERVVLSADTDQSGLLVLADSFYPGWRAFVDGEQVPIIQTNGMFRGVFLERGNHTVVFEMDSESYNNGRALSLMGLAVVVLLAAGLFLVQTARAMREQ